MEQSAFGCITMYWILVLGTTLGVSHLTVPPPSPDMIHLQERYRSSCINPMPVDVVEVTY